MKIQPNTIGLIVATVIVAGGAYWYFFTGTGNDVPITESSVGSGAEARFQALAGELNPITFDKAIFSDPRFLSLEDLKTPITPETSGRSDPFAELPGLSSSDSTP